MIGEDHERLKEELKDRHLLNKIYKNQVRRTQKMNMEIYNTNKDLECMNENLPKMIMMT
jgi:hypothetical protein